MAQRGRPKFGVIVSTAPEDYGRADATFIAHARTDVPTLCAEVRRLRAAMAAVCSEGDSEIPESRP